MRRGLLSLMVGGLVCAWLSAAPAATPRLEDGAPDMAQQRYTLGRELYRRGDVAGAAREFEGAYAMYPASAKLAYNLGRCYERLNDLPRAIRYYSDYLNNDPDAEDADQVKALVESLEARAHEEGVADGPVGYVPPAPPASARALGVMLQAGIYDHLSTTVRGSKRNEALESSVGLAVQYDLPLFGGLRAGARGALHGGSVSGDFLLDGTDTLAMQIGGALRYVMPVGRFVPYAVAAGGYTYWQASGEAFDGSAHGAHVVFGGGVALPVWQIELTAGVVGSLDFLPTIEWKSSGLVAVQGTSEADGSRASRVLFTLGVNAF
ncbi:MAG: tetratricopeptide repeat protein [Myxococcales bacterium]|nr:tetratricopeptide repeat protein [Myxococcales bacterium]